MMNTKIEWYQHQATDPIPKHAPLPQMWWADFGSDDFMNIAPIQDPILNRQMWSLDHNTHEVGRFDTLQEAKDFGQKFAEAIYFNPRYIVGDEQ